MSNSQAHLYGTVDTVGSVRILNADASPPARFKTSASQLVTTSKKIKVQQRSTNDLNNLPKQVKFESRKIKRTIIK
jgi:hypothetical protein